MASLIARSPLHVWHQARGVRFADDQSWKIPAVYTSTEKEIAAARSGVGLADISAFAKFSLRGADIESVAGALVGSALKPRKAVLCDVSGPVLTCRLTSDHLLLLASTTSATAIQERLANLLKDQELVQTDMTSAY